MFGLTYWSSSEIKAQSDAHPVGVPAVVVEVLSLTLESIPIFSFVESRREHAQSAQLYSSNIAKNMSYHWVYPSS